MPSLSRAKFNSRNFKNVPCFLQMLRTYSYSYILAYKELKMLLKSILIVDTDTDTDTLAASEPIPILIPRLR